MEDSLANGEKKSLEEKQKRGPMMLTNGTGVSLEEHRAKAWDFWRNSLKGPKSVLAPMVEQVRKLSLVVIQYAVFY